jgi:hypothetical protein
LIQLSENHPELIIRGEDKGDVDLLLTVETFQGAAAFEPIGSYLAFGEETTTLVDTSKRMAARAFAVVQDEKQRFAGGAKVALSCDSDIDITQITTAGVDKSGSTATPRDYLPRNLWMEWQLSQIKYFWLESDTPGNVECELIVNGEPSGEKVTVQFY